MNSRAIAFAGKPVSAKRSAEFQGARSACDKLAPENSGLLERYRRDQSALRQEIVRSARRARNEDLRSLLGRIFG
jgi:K+-transporting ATPase c subunit